MIDKEAIVALQAGAAIEQASNAMGAALKDGQVIGLPEDFTVLDLEKYLSLRRRARGTMTTQSIADFAAYTVHHDDDGGTTVFVNPEDMRATAVLNLGTPTAPGHADNRAKLDPKSTASYRALLTMATGAGQAQLKVAEFLEDWAPLIKCFNDAGPIAAPQAIAAIRKITVESLRKLESEEQSLSASRSAFEQVSATSKDPIPTTIYFECQPYADLAARLFVLRLGVLTGGDKPMVNLRIVKHEEHLEEMARELADKITQAFGDTEIPVLLGSYTAGA